MHEDHCNCAHGPSATGQSLAEVDWERGIWPAAQNAENDRIRKLLSSAKSSVDQRDVSGYTALVRSTTSCSC